MHRLMSHAIGPSRVAIPTAIYRSAQWPEPFSSKTLKKHSAGHFAAWGPWALLYPKGAKIEKIQDRHPGLKMPQAGLKFSSVPPANPLFFVGNSEGPGLKFSIEIEIFDRD